ncbi:hypothetical protein EDD11_006969 [Mortierella claussenii]|nr:hypothetical protein EDD11_006969 [Mortierella claussenii]
MAANNLPLGLIFRRSVTEGFVKNDDPELNNLRLHRISNEAHQKTSNGNGRYAFDDELESETDDDDDDDDHSVPEELQRRSTVPLSKDPSIYYQKIGLTSTTRRVKLSTTSAGSSAFNTINSRSSRANGDMNGSTGSVNSVASHQQQLQQHRAPIRGYGLSEFSTDEEEEERNDDESDEDGFSESGSDYNTSDSEEELFPVAPHRKAQPEVVLEPADRDKQELMHYVAHITGRMDPWSLKLQKLQEEGKVTDQSSTGNNDIDAQKTFSMFSIMKLTPSTMSLYRHSDTTELGPQIAEKITNDFKTFDTNTNRPSSAWIRESDDITQRLESMTLETEVIKERRRKEIEAKNQALNKDIEACLARIKEEREAAIRIREEALRKAQEERDRIAKEAEDKKKAEQAEKEAKEKQAADVAAAAAEKIKKAAAVAAERASANTSAIFVSEAASAEYKHYTQTLEHIRTKVLPAVTSNPVLKKFCFGARRDIVASIGQLINKKQEVYRVASEIDNYFKKTMSNSEDAYYWVLNCTAKKLVKQAENEALVKSAPTFPLAHVAVLLFTNHPRFLDVLMARFAKKCPYVTPMYIQKEPNDTPDQALARMGYKRTGKGFETEAQYNARQAAMFTLYCAIMQTTPSVGQNIHPLSHAWTWMARITNMPPRPITPSLITVFLEVCGNSYLKTYRKQAAKVLQLLRQEFIPLIPKQGIDGTTRLLILLGDYTKTGQIPVAEGREFDC